ncbi:30S ribosomal protein S1 [Durusdinium trenchii]|uniref:30S ribosomal protein S1 n=1 Tax=Durusdinium trenchii TaxID=1381693 RepID=A0ABP0M2S5_9DINO
MWPRSSGCAPRGFALQPGAPSVPGASFTTRVCGDLRTRTVLAFRRQMTLSRRLHDVAVALHASPEVSDRWVLIGVVVVFWNFLIVTLAILAEIPSERSRKTLALAVDEAEGPVPSLIPSWQELGFGRESKPEEKRPWSPSKDDLDEGLLRSEGLEATLAFDSIASSSQSLVVFGSLLPRHAEVTLTLLQRFLPTEEEKRFGQKAVMFLATQSNAEDEKFWKRKAAHLLTLARLGADCGTLLAGLLDPEPGQDVDGLMQFLHGHPIGREVAHLLQERKAIGDLVTLFDLRAQQDDLGRAGGALDTWPASAQLCHQLFVQSCRDSRPVLVELTSRALRLVEEHSPKDALAAVALARSALDFHAPVARSLGYDLPVDPNAVGLLPIPHCETLPATLEHFGLLLRYPSEYRLVLDWFDRQFGFLDRILTHGIRVVKVALHQNRGFQALGSGYKVKSRMKSPQSLMKKLLQGRRVNDLLGLEVIVQPRHLLSGKGEATAFAAASAILKYVSSVEAGWKIAPNSFKDYVSKPKKSGYQAIHLTLVTDFQANTLSVRHQSQAPCQLELHIFTTQMKLRERQGPASHATYKSFPLCPEDLMEKLGNEGVVSISEVAHHDFDADASQKLEELAQRAGYQDMDIEDLRLSRAHVNKVVSAFQELMAAETTSTLPLGDETDAASLPDGRRTSLIRRARGGEGDALADTVSALCPDDSQWYPGAIEKINDDGTFSVKWDDPDGGPETHDIEVADIQKIVIFKDYKVGERVEAIFPDDGYWYPADREEGRSPEVTKVGDGRFTVKWDDPDGGPEESEVDAKDREMKYPPIPYGDIEIGKMKYDGTVRSVLDFGAFVDIGAESEGLLHISRISGERVENIYDVLSEGQKVEVWVSGKREDEEKFGLTMVEGKMDSAPRALATSRRTVQGAPADLTPFADLPSDEWYNGKVARTAPFGAFVTVTLDSGAQADGLVHVSKIKDTCLMRGASTLLTCLSTLRELRQATDVKVRIEDVDLDSNRMRLSMREGGFGGGPRAPVDLTPFESISPDNWLKGKVARLAPFGAFVTVTTPDGDATADGFLDQKLTVGRLVMSLVHITQIRDGFVESVEDELQVGQEVEVRVESANNEDGKMSLSMKQPF